MLSEAIELLWQSQSFIGWMKYNDDYVNDHGLEARISEFLEEVTEYNSRINDEVPF
ncbi:hypothetical protein ACFLT1_06515 [Bacteroidota bacterium]